MFYLPHCCLCEKVVLYWMVLQWISRILLHKFWMACIRWLSSKSVFDLFGRINSYISTDNVITCKRLPHHWPFVREIHRWPVDSPHKGTIIIALVFLCWQHDQAVEHAFDVFKQNTAVIVFIFQCVFHFFRRHPVVNTPRINKLANGSLSIRHLVPADGGNYTCRAENGHGADEMTVALVVQGGWACIWIKDLITVAPHERHRVVNDLKPTVCSTDYSV